MKTMFFFSYLIFKKYKITLANIVDKKYFLWDLKGLPMTIPVFSNLYKIV